MTYARKHSPKITDAAGFLMVGWLTPDGEWIDCPNWDHMREAAERFPDAPNPEWAAIIAGWLKIYAYGIIGKPLTGAQKEALEACSQNWREIEEQAVDALRHEHAMRASR